MDTRETILTDTILTDTILTDTILTDTILTDTILTDTIKPVLILSVYHRRSSNTHSSSHVNCSVEISEKNWQSDSTGIYTYNIFYLNRIHFELIVNTIYYGYDHDCIRVLCVMTYLSPRAHQYGKVS